MIPRFMYLWIPRLMYQLIPTLISADTEFDVSWLMDQPKNTVVYVSGETLFDVAADTSFDVSADTLFSNVSADS